MSFRAQGLARALLIGVLGCASCGGQDEPLTVFAAASLRDVCGELGAEYEARGNGRVEFNFAGSNLLARQIIAARGADVFLSADEHQVDVVEAAGHVADGTRDALLTNRLVVIVPTDSDERSVEAADWLRVERLSLANPELVPAGRYARAWLEGRGAWPLLAERVLPAIDVRAALAAVESGAADMGICYVTDAARSDLVRVIHKVPVDEAPRIVYVGCALEDSEEGREFLEFLREPVAREAFQSHGFGVLEGGR